jgi:hypothetical protein
MARIRDRLQATSLLVLLIAIPLCAQTHLPAPQPLCFTSGSATYRLSADAEAADYTVAIADIGAPVDLRLALVDDPQDADFVLVDDPQGGEGTPCKASAAVRTVRIAERDANPDVTISLSAAPGASDYRLYVRSARFSHADAAAVMAVMFRADRTQHLAARHEP